MTNPNGPGRLSRVLAPPTTIGQRLDIAARIARGALNRRPLFLLEWKRRPLVLVARGLRPEVAGFISRLYIGAPTSAMPRREAEPF